MCGKFLAIQKVVADLGIAVEQDRNEFPEAAFKLPMTVEFNNVEVESVTAPECFQGSAHFLAQMTVPARNERQLAQAVPAIPFPDGMSRSGCPLRS